MPFDETKYTPKQLRFVDEYLVDLNATQAAIRAGYSPDTASASSSRMLANVKIKSLVEQKRAELAVRTHITQERVLAELAKIAFANMDDYITVDEDGGASVDLSRLTRDQAAAISQVDSDTYIERSDSRDDSTVKVKRTRLKLASKADALEKIGKHLGLFNETIVHEGSRERPIAFVSVAAAPPAIEGTLTPIEGDYGDSDSTDADETDD